MLAFIDEVLVHHSYILVASAYELIHRRYVKAKCQFSIPAGLLPGRGLLTRRAGCSDVDAALLVIAAVEVPEQCLLVFPLELLTECFGRLDEPWSLCLNERREAHVF